MAGYDQHSKHPSTSVTRPDFISTAVAVLAISLAILAAYSNALTGEFVFDDFHAIVNNESIRSILPLSASMSAPRELPTSGRPIVNLSFAINYAIGKLNPLGYHLVNVALHCLNATLLLALVMRTLKNTSWGQFQSSTAWFAAVAIATLWALHPLQTESVSYVTQRSELLMACFLLATLYAARRVSDAVNRRSSRSWQVLGVIFCGLGMASKEVMFVAPVLVVLYDATVLDSKFTQSFKRKWMFYLGLFATWGILFGLMATNPRGKSVGLGLAITPFDYLTTQSWAITHYLWLVLWPVELTSDYGVFIVTQPSQWLPRFMLLGALFAITLVAWFRWPSLSFLGFWFFLILAPTSSVVPIIPEPIAERRMYLPLASIIVFVVLLATELTKRWRADRESNPEELPPKPRFILASSVLILGVTYASATYTRNEVFESDLQFWSDVTQKRPRNQRAFSNLGIAYRNAGSLSLAKASFENAIAIDPTYAHAHFNLGAWYDQNGLPNEAISHFEQAVAAEPLNADSHCNLGACLTRVGQFESAMIHYNRSIELMSNKPEPFFNRGHIYANQGRLAEALDDYTHAIKLAPGWSLAYLYAGNMYYATNQFDQAIAFYEKCVSLQPNHASAWESLGKTYAAQQQWGAAKKCFERALQIQPSFVEAQNALQQLP